MASHAMFGLGNLAKPLKLLDRLLHPVRYHGDASLHDHAVAMAWTARAQRALLHRSQPLVVEVQLYFSCVVKKRVLFHDNPVPQPQDARINDRLYLRFRLVQASSCDPEEFARNYPEQKQLQPAAIGKIYPKQVRFDCIDGAWLGEFTM